MVAGAGIEDFSTVGDMLVVDVVTTGTDLDHDRVIAISTCHLRMSDPRDGGPLSRAKIHEQLLQPPRPVLRSASRVHGIRDRHLRGRTDFSKLAGTLRSKIGDLPVVAHNAAFSIGFLNAEFARCGIAGIPLAQQRCTRARAAVEGPRGDAVTTALGLEGRRRHPPPAEYAARTALAAAWWWHMDHGTGLARNEPGQMLADLRKLLRVMRRHRQQQALSSWWGTLGRAARFGVVWLAMFVLLQLVALLFSG